MTIRRLLQKGGVSSESVIEPSPRRVVDGRFVGLAPLRLADVEPGDHQVTLELGGYRSAAGRVRVDAGRTAALTTTLRAVE